MGKHGSFGEMSISLVESDLCLPLGELGRKKSSFTKFDDTLWFPDNFMKTAQLMHFALKFPSVFLGISK